MGHPSLRLVAWFCAVVALQRVHGWWLLGLLPAALAAVGGQARARWRVLLRRSRILLAVLGLTYLFLTPGEALVAGWWGTREGAVAAADQLLRIVLVLGAVAWLLATTPVAELLAGIYGLLRARPAADATLRGVAERFAIRLALVLRYAESPVARDWRTLLDATDPEAGEAVQFEAVPMRPADYAVAAALVLATVALFLR